MYTRLIRFYGPHQDAASKVLAWMAHGWKGQVKYDPYARPYEVRHYVVEVPPPVLCPSAVASVLCGMMRLYGVTVFAGRPTPTTFDFYNWSGKVW